MRITLLQRPGPIVAERFAADLETAVSAIKGKLSASIRLAEFSEKGWARLDVDGDDREIMVELISRTLGRAQTELSNIEEHGNYQGIIIGERGGDLEVDIGVEKPRTVNVKIKSSSLRAQLADGKLLPGVEIIDNYCLLPDSNVSIRVTRLEADSGVIEGWLSDSQIKLFSEWVTAGLDRIQVFHCFREEVQSAVRKANLERDIIATEPMTLTVHSVLCKLGTDAVGLIPKLGSVLRKSELNPFIPKRIMARCRQW
jgi:hypothetical protein